MEHEDPKATITALLPELSALRRELHRFPEASGEEEGTAARIAAFVGRHEPNELLCGVGGHGVVAIYEGEQPGPTVLLRADLDAVPVPEPASLGLGYLSEHAGLGHKCGHDGHMATLAGMAPLLVRRRPQQGRVALLFQPAEENGAGAAAVLADESFASRVRPDYVFAYHNLPGQPLGQVLYREGSFAWASVGLDAGLEGFTSHAGYPEQGRSPGPALAELLVDLPRLPGEVADSLVTVIHARLGEVAFGTSPGQGRILATLRAAHGAELQRLKGAASARLDQVAAAQSLSRSLSWVEEFPETRNEPGCVAALTAACAAAGVEAAPLEEAFRWSEDFGHFTGRYPGALFGIGAGHEQPPLHHPDYDFPEELLEIGLRVYWALVERLLG